MAAAILNSEIACKAEQGLGPKKIKKWGNIKKPFAILVLLKAYPAILYNFRNSLIWCDSTFKLLILQYSIHMLYFLIKSLMKENFLYIVDGFPTTKNTRYTWSFAMFHKCVIYNCLVLWIRNVLWTILNRRKNMWPTKILW